MNLKVLCPKKLVWCVRHVETSKSGENCKKENRSNQIEECVISKILLTVTYNAWVHAFRHEKRSRTSYNSEESTPICSFVLNCRVFNANGMFVRECMISILSSSLH